MGAPLADKIASFGDTSLPGLVGRILAAGVTIETVIINILICILSCLEPCVRIQRDKPEDYADIGTV